ncbi:MAG: hypothetical protein WCK89_06570 [bacterium]
MPQNKVSLAKLIVVGVVGGFIGIFIGEVVFFATMLAVGFEMVKSSDAPVLERLLPMLVILGSATAGAWLMVRLEKESHASKTCPICEGNDIIKVDSEQITAVNGDRLCRSCQTLWTPAVSKLAATVKLACSGFLLLVGIVFLLLLASSPNNFKYKTVGPAVAIALAIGTGIASIRTIIGSVKILRGKGGELKIVRQGG